MEMPNASYNTPTHDELPNDFTPTDKRHTFTEDSNEMEDHVIFQIQDKINVLIDNTPGAEESDEI